MMSWNEMKMNLRKHMSMGIINLVVGDFRYQGVEELEADLEEEISSMLTTEIGSA